jgi:ParB-like chromosome segregation protein Spo0J
MLTENGTRDDLTAIEEAHGYQLALELNGLTPAKLAKRLGKPKTTVASRLSLTKLPEPVQQRVHDGQLNLRDAEAMVATGRDTVAPMPSRSSGAERPTRWQRWPPPAGRPSQAAQRGFRP